MTLSRPWPWCRVVRPTSSPARSACPGTGSRAPASILDALHSRRARTIGLGRADGRYFTFCAGFGLDAEVVRKVERARLRGKVSTPALYMRSTVSQFFLDTDRQRPLITLERPGEETESGHRHA